MVKYLLKSGKETFEVEHSEEQSFEDFQVNAYTLTDIPPKNLKVLFKSKMIKVKPPLCRTTPVCSPSPKAAPSS